jgi:hypothetical protein
LGSLRKQIAVVLQDASFCDANFVFAGLPYIPEIGSRTSIGCRQKIGVRRLANEFALIIMILMLKHGAVMLSSGQRHHFLRASYVSKPKYSDSSGRSHISIDTSPAINPTCYRNYY